MKRNSRNTLQYRIGMFFYRLTWNDIKKFYFEIRNLVIEFFTIILIFFFIFIFPAFFH